jgi:hypothetical protein
MLPSLPRTPARCTPVQTMRAPAPNGIAPYNVADMTPATNPSKDLTVNTFPANCTAKAAWVYIEATFDNVYIN